MKSINKISPVWLFCCSVIPVPTALADFLENPQPGSAQSGVSLISGWVCNLPIVYVVIDGSQTYTMAYGTERTDTLSACGDTNNGFGFLFNYNKLGDGQHTLQALADGVEFGQATFTVTTLGQEYLEGASRTFELPDFPNPGTTLTLTWQEHLQNFTIAGKKSSGASSITPGLYTGVTSQGNGCSILGGIHPNDSCEVRLNIKSIDGDRVVLSPSPQVDFMGGMSSECGGQAGVGEPVSFMVIAHCPIGSCAGGQCPVLFSICSTIEISNGSFNYAGIHGNCTDNVCSGTINGGASCSFSWTATLK